MGLASVAHRCRLTRTESEWRVSETVSCVHSLLGGVNKVSAITHSFTAHAGHRTALGLPAATAVKDFMIIAELELSALSR